MNRQTLHEVIELALDADHIEHGFSLGRIERLEHSRLAHLMLDALIAAEPDHIVEFTGERWTVQHSMRCRIEGDLFNCNYHRAIAAVAADGIDTDDFGRWRITDIDSEGLPSLERIEG